MADNRSSNRRRTVLKGQVVFNNRASAIDCTVRDLSDTGFKRHSELNLWRQLKLDPPH